MDSIEHLLMEKLKSQNNKILLNLAFCEIELLLNAEIGLACKLMH